jgi:2-polyprenyl-3-methyl-5-hydroxy-6-metoxy-1,4-benzoquinol methylase
MEEVINCPICGEKEKTSYLSCKDYTVSRETFTIAECRNCKFRYTNPRPSESEIFKYYKSEEYISHTNSNKGIIDKIYQQVRQYAIYQKILLIKKYIPPKTILDYGCGTGEFLATCKKCKIEPWGYEPSAEASELCKKNYNITPLTKDELYNLSNEKFSVITLWHVLEHIHTLNETIDKLFTLLQDGGYLFIAVPNHLSYDAKYYNEYWAAYDLPRHLYHFTPESIKILLEKHRLEYISCHPMKFDSYYVSILSEKYKRGKNNLLKSFIIGLKSNLFASNNKWSSQIYVFRKEKN